MELATLHKLVQVIKKLLSLKHYLFTKKRIFVLVIHWNKTLYTHLILQKLKTVKYYLF